MSDPLASIQENNGVSQTDYLKLFMQELTYQDPLKPVDNREFMAQMAQFSALQQAQTTNDNLAMLNNFTSANQSLMLLGKTVKIRNSEEEAIVNKVEFPDKAPPRVHLLMKGEVGPVVELKDIIAVY